MKRGNLCWYLEQQTDQFVDFVDICQESGCMIELALKLRKIVTNSKVSTIFMRKVYNPSWFSNLSSYYLFQKLMPKAVFMICNCMIHGEHLLYCF